jgi:menaquinone-dependent protoporphyrinogen oxidase
MRVLITAATRHEATAELAEAIAAALRRRDIDAQARPIGEVAEVGGYDAVVLGSAVYVGRWLREARRFAESNAATLATMPVWLFSSGPVGPGGESGPADADTLAELTGAREHRVFAGRLDRRRLGLAERFVVRMARVPMRDDRDWAAVEEFADDIADALEAEDGAADLRERVGLRAGT